MFSLGRILLPVDFSERSQSAGRYAGSLARRFGAQLVLIHVLSPPHYELASMEAGGAILVDNKPISSPYSVRAIGPPRELREAFDRTPGLYRLRLLEVSYGVVVRVDGRSGADLTLPAGSVRDVRFAKQMGES